MRASQTVHSQLPTRSDRLDSLPFGREHRKLLVGSGVGWALDAMDVGLISYELCDGRACGRVVPVQHASVLARVHRFRGHDDWRLRRRFAR